VLIDLERLHADVLLLVARREVMRIVASAVARDLIRKLAQDAAIVVNDWSRSRPNQAVLDGTPVTADTGTEQEKCWSQRCPLLP